MTVEVRRCHDCGGDMVPGVTTYCDVAGGLAIVEDVPAFICGQCGARAIPSRVVRELARLLDERPTPTRVAKIPVYGFAASKAGTIRSVSR